MSPFLAVSSSIFPFSGFMMAHVVVSINGGYPKLAGRKKIRDNSNLKWMTGTPMTQETSISFVDIVVFGAKKWLIDLSACC